MPDRAPRKVHRRSANGTGPHPATDEVELHRSSEQEHRKPLEIDPETETILREHLDRRPDE